MPPIDQTVPGKFVLSIHDGSATITHADPVIIAPARWIEAIIRYLPLVRTDIDKNYITIVASNRSVTYAITDYDAATATYILRWPD